MSTELTCASNNLPTEKPSVQNERENLFIANLFVCKDTTEAAVAAGYSTTYAATSVRLKLQRPQFLEKVREYARSHELLESIPKILKLENQALKYLDGKPEQLPKFAAMLKQKKQIAGLLSQDVVAPQTTININDAQNMMIKMYQVSADNKPGDGPK